MQIELSVVLSAGIALFGAWATFQRMQRDAAKDREHRQEELLRAREKETERHTEIRAELRSISGSMNQIVLDVNNIDKKVSDLDKEMVLVKRSADSCHERVDRIEQRCYEATKGGEA